jgi:pimeloyl-ACP methyl ester carboxylesterase
LLKQHCQVFTPDLAGSGKEHGDFVQLVGNVLMNQSQPVILVGHSSGGIVISELAKQYPEKIKALVYLSAFLLPQGQSPPEVIQEDKASLLPEALVADTLTGRVRVKKEMAKAVFYHDCSDSIANWAIARLTSEPQVPSSSPEPASMPTHSTGRISPPRFYIETLQDRALSITTQRRMYQKLPCQKVYSLPGSHSPFFSQPEKLTAILLDIHQQVKDK